MPLEHCCFISYPHGQDDVLVPFVKAFTEGLEKEVYAQTRKNVWVDYKFVTGGNRLGGIGVGLCKSACMILLYTPLYFDRDHTYCAQELKAMQDLEAQRLQLMRDRDKGLIIPVILRGEKRFPRLLKEDRHFYLFDDIEFNDPPKKLRIRYSKELREIAEYIVDRNELLDRVQSDLTHDCAAYCLPTPEDARNFVETVLQITNHDEPFVARKERLP